MNMRVPIIAFAGWGILSSIGSVATAVPVQVTVTGVVESSVIQGNQANVPDGAPVVMSFQVDSTNFLNSPSFPTRGYPINLSSFNMTAGGQPINITNPQVSGTAYFVLRNNDPAVDGFFVSKNVDVPIPVDVNIPGLTPVHELDFSRTFNDGTPLPSLNILDALGSYDFSNISSYNWTIGRFGNPGALYTYETITLAAVPEPATAGALFVMGALMRERRR